VKTPAIESREIRPAHTTSLQAFRYLRVFGKAMALLNYPWGEHPIVPTRNSGLQLSPDEKLRFDLISNN